MIPPSAVRSFLLRPLNDYRPLKSKATHRDLNVLLEDAGVCPWHELMLHQKLCVHLGVKNKNFAFFCDMGSGKTLIALELIQYWFQQGKAKRALVFVTSDKAFSSWERQIKQYKIEVPFVSLDAPTSIGKWEQLEGFGDGIVLLHYPGTLAMVSDTMNVGVETKKKKWFIHPHKLNALLHGIDILVLDESTRVANRRSLTYELCEAASKRAKYRYALSGMPFGRNPEMLWPQMKLIDRGETLGQTLGLFREAFFTKHFNYFGGPYSYDYVFKKNMTDKLSTMLQHRSITYTAAECIDLPEVAHITETVRLPKESLQYFHQAVADMIAARQDMRAVSNVFLRMRQISSGFIGLKDDETGDSAHMTFSQNPKLDRLLELIEELPVNRKALIFYEFTHSGQRIYETLLKELKLKPIWLWSGTKDPRATLDMFIYDPAYTVAVINNKVGAYSLDGLQVANYEFHYETAVSVIDRAQAEKRIVRNGQIRKCFIYDLVAKGTADDKILSFHKEGKDLFKALLTDAQVFSEGA